MIRYEFLSHVEGQIRLKVRGGKHRESWRFDPSRGLWIGFDVPLFFFFSVCFYCLSILLRASIPNETKSKTHKALSPPQQQNNTRPPDEKKKTKYKDEGKIKYI